jgi:hypothetical protein
MRISWYTNRSDSWLIISYGLVISYVTNELHKKRIDVNWKKGGWNYSSWNAFFCWLTAFGYSNNQREATITKCEVGKAKFWESLTYMFFYSNFDNLH